MDITNDHNEGQTDLRVWLPQIPSAYEFCRAMKCSAVKRGDETAKREGKHTVWTSYEGFCRYRGCTYTYRDYLNWAMGGENELQIDPTEWIDRLCRKYEEIIANVRAEYARNVDYVRVRHPTLSEKQIDALARQLTRSKCREEL